VFVTLTDERTYDTIRDTVADLGAGLIRVEQERRTLEDLFRDEPVAGGVA
jgi:ABC-2 type transport system ATP-binding protein